MEILLTITSGQKILVMWDLLAVIGTRHSLIFFKKEPYYNIMLMSNVLGWTVPEGQK